MPEYLTKCSNCGAQVVIPEGADIAYCSYCAFPNEKPRIDSAMAETMRRGDELRRQCLFEEANECYRAVLRKHPDNHAALWGRLMCKYGIEAVEENKGGRKQRYLVCHRARFSSIRNEGDFKAACANADEEIRRRYISDAEYIDAVQAKIREAAADKEDWDVFICYKETDILTGARTEESRIAQEIYNRLSANGYRVFYARQTLESLAGSDYEAEIFRAINTAKLMIVIGMKREHFNATWPKSEWMRYLERMERGEGYLIPLFGGGKRAEDTLPEEFLNGHRHGINMDQNPVYMVDIETIMLKVFPERQKKPEPDDTDNKEDPVLPPDDEEEKNKEPDPHREEEKKDVEQRADDKRNDEKKDDEKKDDGRKNGRRSVLVPAAVIAALVILGFIGYNAIFDRLAKDVFSNDENTIKLEQTAEPTPELTSEHAAEVPPAFTPRPTPEHTPTPTPTPEPTPTPTPTPEPTPTPTPMPEPLRLLTKLNVGNHSLRYGEKMALVGRIQAEGDGEISYVRVTVGNQIVAEATVNAAEFDLSAFVIDTTVAPFNESGTYELVVGIFGSDGQIISQDLCSVNVIVPAPLKIELELSMDDRVLLLGEKMPLSGYVNTTGEGMISHVSVYTGETLLAERLVDATDFDLSAFSVDTAVHPFDEPGTYPLTVSVRGSDGQVQSAQMGNVIVTAPEPTPDPIHALLSTVKVTGGRDHTVILGHDGIAVAFGSNQDPRKSGSPMTTNQSILSGWDNIVDIAAGDYHTVGLRSDGTVVAVGQGKEDQCDVKTWSNIIDIAAGDYHTVGLQSGGMSLVATGRNKYGQCDVQGLIYAGSAPVVSVAAGYEHTAVLREDGTAAAIGNNNYGQLNIGAWNSIVQIDAGTYHTIGLRSDGTVIAAGSNDYHQCDVSGWNDIVAVAAGDYFTLGLRADGTVVATGRNDFGQCNVSGWNDVIKIGAGGEHSLGVRADGSGIAAGRNDFGQCGYFGFSTTN